MMISRTQLRSLLALLTLALPMHSALGQISRSVGLLQGQVTQTDGTPLPNVTVVIFRGVDRVTSTRSNAEGAVTAILQPNSVYRFVVNENGYMYREDTLRVPALSAYTKFPVHLVLSPLHDGQLFNLPQPVFEPRSHGISPNALAQLTSISFQLQHNPKLTVSVVVYPDAPVKTKRDAAQKSLANARASAMSAFFSGKGIGSDRFSVVSVTTMVPQGIFPMPAYLVSSKKPSKKTRGRKTSASAEPSLFPQYVEIMAHLAP